MSPSTQVMRRSPPPHSAAAPIGMLHDTSHLLIRHYVYKLTYDSLSHHTLVTPILELIETSYKAPL